MATVMTIGGVDLGPDFPTISQTYEKVRLVDDGPSYTKVVLTLTGFRLGDSCSEVETKLQELRTVMLNNRVAVTIQFDSVTMYNNKTMYVVTQSEPDGWRQYDEDFTLSFFYYVSSSENNFSASASFNGYSFPVLPSFKRGMAIQRSDELDALNTGKKRIDITISGFIMCNGVADGISKQDALLAACADGSGTLTYGGFSQTCRVDRVECAECVPENKILYTITFFYYSGTIFEIYAETTIPRVHNNLKIKEKPGCGTRVLQLGNQSGQTISYKVSVRASDVATAQSQAATELNSRILGSGIEVEGGSMNINENTCTVSITAMIYYDTPIVNNL